MDSADLSVQQLLNEISALSPSERVQRLEQLRADNADLAESLQAALALQETFVNAGAHVDTPKLERLGNFRVLALIGQGGMGLVYLGEQDQPRRKVALKVMRQGAQDREAAQRFRREGAALALLDHPGIAKVYAAGVEETLLGSLPYFAMEYIDGVSLLEHANRQKLDTPSRLRLMVAICHAVQHAHQRGVVHRDLKPANILIDAEGQPHILDFGIARLIDEGDGATRLTEIGALVGTLPYMAPEQLNGDSALIDTRADVYALGVMLFELLSGKRPREFEISTSVLQAVAVAMRKPVLPLVEANPEHAGDLDTIAMKALAEEPAQRYASASELAADIKRYLDNEPILARPPSAWYVAQKFARRHRALVAISILALLALVASTVFALNAAWREREARRVAEQSAATSTAVQQFMNAMFEAAMPESALGREVTVREVVDQASLRLQFAPPDDPLVAAEAGVALAQVNLMLGRIDQAQQLVNTAGETLDHLGERGQDARIDAAIQSLQIRAARAADADAEQGARDLVAEIRQKHGAQDPRGFEASNLLGDILLRQSKFKEAIEQYEQALDAPLSALPADHRERESALANIAVALRGMGDLKSAITVLTELEKGMSARRGPEHPLTLSVVNNLALALQNSGEAARALALYDRAYAGRSKVLGTSHPDTLNVLQNRATLLIQTDKAAQAEPILRQLLKTLTETRQKNHPAVLVAMNSLAYALEDLNRLDEAETLYRDNLAIQLEANTAHSEAFSTRNNLAMLLMRKNDLKAAEAEFIAVLDMATEHLGPEHPYVLIFANNYGECLTRMRRFAEAEPLLLNTQSALLKSLGPKHDRVLKARVRLADLYDAMQQPERAAPWRGEPRETAE
jgi:eukaryotic-like serine/threonine-protein kinase